MFDRDRDSWTDLAFDSQAVERDVIASNSQHSEGEIQRGDCLICSSIII